MINSPFIVVAIKTKKADAKLQPPFSVAHFSQK